MTYGYFNGFITDIGEDVPAKVNELKQYADVIMVESLSSRVCLLEIIDSLQPGDVVYVHSFRRFCSGLSDLCKLMNTIIDDKQAHLVSLHNHFDSRTEIGLALRDAYETALQLTNADPTHGVFK